MLIEAGHGVPIQWWCSTGMAKRDVRTILPGHVLTPNPRFPRHERLHRAIRREWTVFFVPTRLYRRFPLYWDSERMFGQRLARRQNRPPIHYLFLVVLLHYRCCHRNHQQQSMDSVRSRTSCCGSGSGCSVHECSNVPVGECAHEYQRSYGQLLPTLSHPWYVGSIHSKQSRSTKRISTDRNRSTSVPKALSITLPNGESPAVSRFSGPSSSAARSSFSPNRLAMPTASDVRRKLAKPWVV